MKTVVIIFFVILSREETPKYCKYSGYNQNGDTMMYYSRNFAFQKGDTVWVR